MSREREVVELMAQGRSNAAIAETLWITEGAVEKHIKHIFKKLRIPAAPDTNRRVLAVLTFLEPDEAAYPGLKDERIRRALCAPRFERTAAASVGNSCHGETGPGG